MNISQVVILFSFQNKTTNLKAFLIIQNSPYCQQLSSGFVHIV